MDVDAYLERIGYRGSREPTEDTLTRLHEAHMFSVPFENLDIPLGNAIELSLPSLFDKIVLRHRGGFCYELNGLFARLLEELGFRLERLQAQVFGADGRLGPEFDHMLLRVTLDDDRQVLADVGFGDSFVAPVPFRGEGGDRYGRSYRQLERRGGWVLERAAEGSGWAPQYLFRLDAYPLEAFEPMCRYQQTSPDSVFTRKSVCSKATADGRITLANGRWIVTASGRREERAVANVEEYRTLLRQHFGFDLGGEACIERLLVAPG